MIPLELSGLPPVVADRVGPFFEETITGRQPLIHSVHIVGSAVVPDYNEKLSDINSLVLLHKMELQFISFLAPLGKKYGKKGVAAPIVMTPEYIRKSLDAFPIEFLDFKRIHKTVYGSDILQELQIAGPQLRLQCEREIKTKLIGLRQGYISSLGKKERLAAVLVRSFTGSMALFRAIISLLGNEPPVSRAEVIKTFGNATRIETGIFEKLLMLKARAVKPSEQELHVLFEQYHNALEATGTIIDELHA